ncbi:MAG: prenyltransferase/squalene oxidase repeat-containing protein [Planctomycetota bacterium]
MLRSLLASLLLVAPVGAVEIDVAIREGVAFLVKNQNKDGSFGARTSGRTYEVTSAVPGGHYAFQAATTALCWLGLDDSPHKTEASKKAQARALDWLVKNARVKRAHGGQLYNTWSFGYGLHALARAYRKSKREDVKKTAESILAAIARYQTPDGGWGYYDFGVRAARPEWSTSFSTATIVVALKEAEIAGLTVSPKVVDKAITNIKRCRKPDGTYLYGMYMRYRPMHGVNQPQGSALRVQSCGLALQRYGHLGLKELRAGLEMLHKHERFSLAGVRRPIPHESWYAVSGYFYLYGYRYAASVLKQLPKAERPRHAKRIAAAVLKTRQPDGSFWDYPLYGYHKFYGTGYALMALARCAACSSAD